MATAKAIQSSTSSPAKESSDTSKHQHKTSEEYNCSKELGFKTDQSSPLLADIQTEEHNTANYVSEQPASVESSASSLHVAAGILLYC